MMQIVIVGRASQPGSATCYGCTRSMNPGSIPTA